MSTRDDDHPAVDALRAALDAWGTEDARQVVIAGRPAAALVDMGCLCCIADEAAPDPIVKVRSVLDDPGTWAPTFQAEAERLGVDPATVQVRQGVTFGAFRDAGLSVPLMGGIYRTGGRHRLLMLVLTRAL